MATEIIWEIPVPTTRFEDLVVGQAFALAPSQNTPAIVYIKIKTDTGEAVDLAAGVHAAVQPEQYVTPLRLRVSVWPE